MSFASDVTALGGFRRDAITRLQMHALLRALDAELLSHDSATLTLERWCEARGLASPAQVVAERQHGAGAEPSSELHRLLAVSATDQIRHRRVRLRCGCRVLSEADNWYVPGRLTEEMNRVLDTTDVAFGRAVRRLNFRRRTLSSTLLWSPLSPEWATDEAPTAGHRRLTIPPYVLQHRAVLTLPDGTPFSHLDETYTRDRSVCGASVTGFHGGWSVRQIDLRRELTDGRGNSPVGRWEATRPRTDAAAAPPMTMATARIAATARQPLHRRRSARRPAICAKQRGTST